MPVGTMWAFVPSRLETNSVKMLSVLPLVDSATAVAMPRVATEQTAKCRAYFGTASDVYRVFSPTNRPSRAAPAARRPGTQIGHNQLLHSPPSQLQRL